MIPLRFALLGDPVAHSKSPVMQAAAFAELGLPHTYQALRTGAGELQARVAELRSGAFAGFNITLPHKRAILPFADVVASTAAIAGAANTLYVAGGRVHATNTDVAAIAAELAALGPDVAGALAAGRALVIGTGGAARAAVTALSLELGATDIVVRGRSGAAAFAAEMQGLLTAVGCHVRVTGEPIVARADDRDFICILQATSAGMAGADSGQTVREAVTWDALPARALAFDVVYAPSDTPFVEAARAHGLRHSGGLGMLARQGALALALWLRCPAPYNAMLAALL